MLFPMDTVLILGIIQFQLLLCDSFTQKNQQIITNNSTWVVEVRGGIDSKYHPPGFHPENVEEGVEAVEKTFEAKAETWIHRQKDPALEKSFPGKYGERGNTSFLSWNQKVGVGVFTILAICFSCCLCLVALCEKCWKDSNPTLPRRLRNRTPRVIQGIRSRQPSPGAYRIHTQSSGLEEYNFAPPANQMMDFRVNMFTDSNDQGIEWSSSGGGGGDATVTASAPPSPRSHSPHLSVLPSSSSTDQSAREHPVRRNLTSSPCRSRKPEAIAKEDEPPPSYDQCVIIRTTIPEPHANATAPPEEYEERQPPYFVK